MKALQSKSSVLGLAFGFLFGVIFFRLSTDFHKTSKQSLAVVSKVINKYGEFNNNSSQPTVSEILNKEVKILCWIMTNPKNEARWKHIRGMWADKCTKLLFMSSKTFYHENFDIEVVGVSVGNDTRSSLWAKTKEAFIYVYRNHYKDYDWFMKIDDDTYLIMENLKYLLYQYNPNDSLYLGHRYSIDANKRGYMAGMAYILSKEALRRFHNQLMAQKCRNDGNGAEDLEMGNCLVNNTVQVDTRDEHERHRFFPVPPNDALDPYGTEYWYQKNQFYKIHIGLSCCSDTPVGFHYVDISHMYLMEYLFYRVQPFGISRNISYILPKKLEMKDILQASLGLHL